MQEKLAVTVLVITLALFGLAVKLYMLVDEKNEEYTEIVLNQQSSYNSRTLPYRRGDIVDRNGTYLATSEKVYNLILDPNQINKDSANYLETTVTALVDVFGYDREEILSAINENPSSYYVKFRRQLSAEEKEAFEAKAKEVNKQYIDSGSRKRVQGVWFEDEYKRVYPYGSVACNVVGFSFDNGKQGSGGIEQFYNDQLIGTNGREYGYLDAESNMEKVIKSAENGNTIVSTIDTNIQKIVEKYIDEWMNGIGSKTAAVLVMTLVAGIIGMVLVRGVPHISWNFLTTTASVLKGTDGILPAILNTLYVILLTLLIVLPLGVGAAVYLTEYASNRRLIEVIEFTNETLAGIPSILYGLVGMLVFSQALGFQTCLLSGSLTLVVMNLPTIIRTTQESLKTVPQGYREGALGLGAGKWHIIHTIVLPCSMDGIVTGCILAVGRIVGESAALLFTAGAAEVIAKGVVKAYTSNGATLSVLLYLRAFEDGDFASAWAIGAVLLVLVLVINLAARLAKAKLKQKQ